MMFVYAGCEGHMLIGCKTPKFTCMFMCILCGTLIGGSQLVMISSIIRITILLTH